MKTRPQRSFLTFSVATALAVGLTACGSDGGNTGSPENDENPTVTVWYGSGPTDALYKEFLTDWGEENNINVEVTAHPGGQMQEAVTLALRSGRGPDVWVGANPTLLRGGYAAPLNEVLTEENKAAYEHALPPSSPLVIDGTIVAVPGNANSIRLAYNKDIFTAAGLDPESPLETLSDVREACEAIAELNGKYCFGLPMKWGPFNQWTIDPIVAQTHADATQNGQWNGTTGKFEMLNYAPVVELLREMVAREWAYPGASTLEIDPMRSAFADGEIAMFVSVPVDAGLLNDRFSTEQDWAVAPLPAIDGETRERQVSPNAGVVLMNAEAENPEAAAAVFNAFIGKELRLEVAKQGLAIPRRNDIDASEFSEGQSPQFAGYLPTDEDTPWAASPLQEMNIQGDSIKDLLRQLIIGDDDIEPALQNMANKYQEVYDTAVESGDIDNSRYEG